MTPIANLNLALATTSPLILSTLFLSLTPTVFFQDPTETELQTAQRKVAELEAELGPEHLDLVNALDRLMVLNYSQGNYSESEDVCRRILRIMEKAFGQDSLELILFLRNMGAIKEKKNSLEESAEFYRRALEIKELNFKKNDYALAQQLWDYGNALGRLDKHDIKIPIFLRLLPIVEGNLGYDHPLTSQVINNLAVSHEILNDYGNSSQLFRRAIDICENKYGPKHFTVGIYLANLGHTLGEMGLADEALGAMERSCEILEKYYLLGENDIEDKGATFSDIRGQYADALTKIGTIQYQLSFYQEAQKSVERCLAIQEEWYSSDHPEISGTLRVLSRWHLERGDYKLAKPLVVRAITIDENYYGRNHSLTAISLSMLASILKNEKKLQESIDLYKEAIEILNGTLGKGHRTTSIILGHLASCYRAKGEGSNAIKFLRKSFKSISLEVSRNLPLMTGAERFQYLDMQRGPEPLLLNLVALQGNEPTKAE